MHLTGSLRIGQSVLAKAGSLKLEQALDKEGGEKLSDLLKFMVAHSAIATGKAKGKDYARRRYGNFVLVIKHNVLVDLIPERKDWCRDCLGTRSSGEPCSCVIH